MGKRSGSLSGVIGRDVLCGGEFKWSIVAGVDKSMTGSAGL